MGRPSQRHPGCLGGGGAGCPSALICSGNTGACCLFFFFLSSFTPPGLVARSPALSPWLPHSKSPSLFLLFPHTLPISSLTPKISRLSFQPVGGTARPSFFLKKKTPPPFENRQQAVSDYFKNPDHLAGGGGLRGG